jgi:hypothetical protein
MTFIDFIDGNLRKALNSMSVLLWTNFFMYIQIRSKKKKKKKKKNRDTPTEKQVQTCFRMGEKNLLPASYLSIVQGVFAINLLLQALQL